MVNELNDFIFLLKIENTVEVEIYSERLSIVAFLASHIKSNLTGPPQLRTGNTIWKLNVFQ